MRCVHRTSSVESYDDVKCAQNIISRIIPRCDVCTEHHQQNHTTMRCVHRTSSVESYDDMKCAGNIISRIRIILCIKYPQIQEILFILAGVFMFTQPHLITRGDRRILDSKVMQTRDAVEGLHNFREFSQPCKCSDQAIEIWKKVLYCFYKIFLEINSTNEGKLCLLTS